MASPLNAQKIDPDGNKAAAAASVAAPAPKKDEKKAGDADDDDDDKPMQSFEGPEKVLEIWWTEVPLTGANAPAPGDAFKRSGLRTIAVDKLKVLLQEVKCCILSSVSNEYVDAYLLSESSMFVYPFQIVLKTCGTTTLLKAVQPLLSLARDSCGLTELNNVFYCRKNFLDPTKQLYPHTSWEHECKELGAVFNGDGHVMGNTTGDHWFLYTTDNKAGVSVLSPQYSQKQTGGGGGGAAGTPQAPKSPQRGGGGAAAAAAAAASAAAGGGVPAAALPPSAKPAAGAAAAGAAVGGAAAATDQKAAPPPLSLEAALHACSNTQRKEVASVLSKLLGRTVNPGASSPSLRGNTSSNNLAAMGAAKGDQTLEILMSELDQSKMKIFTKVNGVDGKMVTQQSGIGALYPDARVDEFVFDPQGYSMNGIRGEGYFTIHITPQPNCSYASFETNIENAATATGGAYGDYATLISQNLDIFGPGKFTVIFFTTADLSVTDTLSRNNNNRHAVFGDFPGYSRSGMHVAPFQTYTVTYCHYQKVAGGVAQPPQPTAKR